MKKCLIRCRDASFSYEGRTVSQDITLEITSGDYLCIVGQNGSGKSTLVKGLVGLKAPAKGKITYENGLTNRRIGYLPQQTTLQRDFPASVREVVLSGTRALFYGEKQKALAMEKMKRMEIEEIADHSYRDLSGGQQQRVLLARALCAAKDMLVLDEPASGLDPLVTRQMYECIARENKERGLTVVMVSHDVSTAVQYADHILHLENNMRFFGTTADYLASGVSGEFLAEGGGVSC